MCVYVYRRRKRNGRISVRKKTSRKEIIDDDDNDDNDDVDVDIHILCYNKNDINRKTRFYRKRITIIVMLKIVV